MIFRLDFGENRVIDFSGGKRIEVLIYDYE